MCLLSFKNKSLFENKHKNSIRKSSKILSKMKILNILGYWSCNAFDGVNFHL